VTKRVILFAGGGTGGHIFPNVAIVERLAAVRPDLDAHFLVSTRAGDASLLTTLGYPFTTTPVRPLPRPSRPWQAIPFLAAWRRAGRSARELIADRNVVAVVATGGFVSGPAIVAAERLGVPRALVNLDAVPGKANRRLATYGPKIFSVFPSKDLPGAELIGLPLRAASIGVGSPAEARAALGLDPGRPLLFVTGATHGAESIVRMMIAWSGSAALRASLDGWHVLHQCGGFPPDELQRAYAAAGLSATVVARLDRIGLAFRAADLAIARAGAGTVAEAWANATPTVFLPNPYHHDQHQRHNARPMVEAGGAVIASDRIDPAVNLAETVPVIATLLGDAARREAMRAALASAPLRDGASSVVAWISATVGG
jgi:UDP-N-acetylglucosamine--N-acetylmuramyl-(pentapeptide) pyrophosphoryl-undecaprenol N-acetylglucosamine transferase